MNPYDSPEMKASHLILTIVLALMAAGLCLALWSAPPPPGTDQPPTGTTSP